MAIVTSSFSKRSVYEMFSSTRKQNSAFLDSSGLKSVFDKLSFRDGLVWTVGLTPEIKPSFQTSQAYCRAYCGPALSLKNT